MTTTTGLPGIAFRRYRGEDDLPAMLDVLHAANEANGIEEIESLEQMTVGYRNLVNCDPDRDILIAEADGVVVAYSRVFWQDLVEGGRTYECFGFVHPAWRRRGIGAAMLAHNESRIAEIAADHDVTPKHLASESVESDAGNTALLRGAGFEPARWFYDMVAVDLDGIAEEPMPAGLELRSVRAEDRRRIWDAQAEAFRDHWGEAEWAEEDWIRQEADPEHADPRFWRVAWDGDAIAGVVTTIVPVEENERYGRSRVYVSGVSVRRPWRRRGLARALLAGSLVAAREAGYTSASLGVDTDSPTGATDLYRSLGFEPVRTYVAWRKPLEGAAGT